MNSYLCHINRFQCHIGNKSLPVCSLPSLELDLLCEAAASPVTDDFLPPELLRNLKHTKIKIGMVSTITLS